MSRASVAGSIGEERERGERGMRYADGCGRHMTHSTWRSQMLAQSKFPYPFRSPTRACLRSPRARARTLRRPHCAAQPTDRSAGCCARALWERWGKRGGKISARGEGVSLQHPSQVGHLGLLGNRSRGLRAKGAKPDRQNVVQRTGLGRGCRGGACRRRGGSSEHRTGRR